MSYERNLVFNERMTLNYLSRVVATLRKMEPEDTPTKEDAIFDDLVEDAKELHEKIVKRCRMVYDGEI